MEATFDESWRRRALAGDPQAVRHLADHCLRPLYRFCLYRVGGDRHLCEEVVQETLVRAMGRLDRYEPDRAEGRILAWLTGLARNEIRRVLTERRRATSLDQMWERMDRELLSVYARLESTPLEGDVLERAETRQMVNATMSQLPAHYREALEAKYVDGQSVRDIAARRHLTEKAAESLLTRARSAFRAAFLTLTNELGASPA